MTARRAAERELRHLAAINRAISSSLDFDEVLRLIVDKAAELLDAETTVLLLADADGRFQTRAAAGRHAAAAEGFRGPMREAVLDQLAAKLGVDAERLRVEPVVSDAGIDGLLACVGCAEEVGGELLPMFADLAAIALRNARTHQVELAETGRRLAEQRSEALLLLQEASKRLLPTSGESPGYAELVEAVRRLTAADAAALWMPESDGGRLEARAVVGVPPLDDESRPRRRTIERPGIDPDSAAPSARAARQREPVLAPDLSVEEARDGGLGTVHAMRSELALPVVARGELLAVISLYFAAVGACNAPHLRELAEVIVGQLAAAIDTGNLIGELARANRLKDQFLATLSHELRNPLNAIVGYAEVLALLPATQGSPESARAVAAIRRNALAQAELVSDLLDLSRLQTGKLALNREPVPLESALRNAIETVRARAELKDVRLEISPTAEPLLVHADPVRLEQIVWNLLDNAVKFSPEHGAVTVRVRRDERAARLEVEDHGQGIDPGFLPHVFEMFRQADHRLNRRHGGMGIGLALVRQLVELQGGRVRAESAGVGRGATFTVWMPLPDAAPLPLPRAPAAAAAELAGLRILLVDDSRDALEPLGRLLELEGASVSAATSGREALERIGAEPFDLLVSDISMPEMDGCELMRRVRSMTGGDGLPAIALTGLGERETVAEVLAAGYVAHLTKPLDVPRLLRLARELGGATGRSRQAAP